MKLLLLLTFMTSVAYSETRCGWIVNPTPANYSIIDKDGDWLIASQGGYQAEGLEDKLVYPHDNEFVRTNINYGYWCGCMKVESKKSEMRIVKILNSKPKLLKACLEDRNLPGLK